MHDNQERTMKLGTRRVHPFAVKDQTAIILTDTLALAVVSVCKRANSYFMQLFQHLSTYVFAVPEFEFNGFDQRNLNLFKKIHFTNFFDQSFEFLNLRQINSKSQTNL
jgi:hypothetical protein